MITRKKQYKKNVQCVVDVHCKPSVQHSIQTSSTARPAAAAASPPPVLLLLLLLLLAKPELRRLSRYIR